MGFATLFAGRADAWFDSDRTRAVRRAVGLEHFRRHLAGSQEIGTYPVLDSSVCRWSCIDIDTNDLDAALDTAQVWRYFGTQPWLERSRSKGYHVWVFTQGWCPATVVRQAGLYISSIAGLPTDTEVNPKGDRPWATATGLINTVRLPYSGKAQPGRMMMLDAALEPIPLPAFVLGAMGSRASLGTLRIPALKYAAQHRARQYRMTEASEQVSQGFGGDASSQAASLILKGLRTVGPGERDNQFHTMARLLLAKHVDEDIALALVERAYNNQVTDHEGFSLEDALSKVRRAYGQ